MYRWSFIFQENVQHASRRLSQHVPEGFKPTSPCIFWVKNVDVVLLSGDNFFSILNKMNIFQNQWSSLGTYLLAVNITCTIFCSSSISQSANHDVWEWRRVIFVSFFFVFVEKKKNVLTKCSLLSINLKKFSRVCVKGR